MTWLSTRVPSGLTSMQPIAGARRASDPDDMAVVAGVNGDPTDNAIRNTIPLCRDCHHEATFPGI